MIMMRRKIYQSLGLLFLLFFTLACSEKDAPDSAADYTVLGLTTVSVGNQIIALSQDGALLDTRNNPSVVADGLMSNPTWKKVEISYVVLIKKGDNTDVTATSIYPDVSVQVVKTINDSRTSYNVTVKRAGYAEQLTYVFHFLVM